MHRGGAPLLQEQCRQDGRVDEDHDVRLNLFQEPFDLNVIFDVKGFIMGRHPGTEADDPHPIALVHLPPELHVRLDNIDLVSGIFPGQGDDHQLQLLIAIPQGNISQADDLDAFAAHLRAIQQGNHIRHHRDHHSRAEKRDTTVPSMVAGRLSGASISSTSLPGVKYSPSR